MNESNRHVENLKKITLSLAAGTSESTMDITPQPSSMEFIFGLGPEGMTPFEYRLVDHRIGDEVLIKIKPGDLSETFQHIPRPVWILPQNLDTVYLRAKILTISQPDNREIVKAMAAIAQHGGDGCGGDCGCGCG